MCKIEFEKSIPAQDGTRCFGCGQCYEIMLMVPPESQGGNCRRFARHYRCDSCNQVFSKYDFAFLFQKTTLYLFGGFIGSLVSAMRPTGGHGRRSPQIACEPALAEEAPVTQWVKKTRFHSRRITLQSNTQRWAEVVNRDFIKIETLLPMHVV